MIKSFLEGNAAHITWPYVSFPNGYGNQILPWYEEHDYSLPFEPCASCFLLRILGHSFFVVVVPL